MPIHLPKSHRKISRWKNGDGCTSVIAISPADAGLDNFDWRISMATITKSGDFSIFPGVDRSLQLIEGSGLRLQIDEAAPFELDEAQPLIRFPGEARVRATIDQGPGADFNVMTRRQTCRQQLENLSLSGHHQRLRQSDTTLIFLAKGAPVICQSGTEKCTLTLHDAILLSRDDAALIELWTGGSSTLIVVDIMPAS